MRTKTVYKLLTPAEFQDRERVLCVHHCDTLKEAREEQRTYYPYAGIYKCVDELAKDKLGMGDDGTWTEISYERID